MGICQQQSIAELIDGIYLKHEFYASKCKGEETNLESKDNVLFAVGSPIGFKNAISDKSNYRQLRNETYIYVNLKRTFVKDESWDNSKSSWKSMSHQNHIAEFAWPMNEFSNFIITLLTKKPNKPQTLIELISGFRSTFKTNLTAQQLKASYKVFYSYIKDTGLFFVRKKFIGIFPKTCCYNQYTITGIQS